MNFKRMLKLNKHLKGNEAAAIKLLEASILLYLNGKISNPVGYFKKNFEPQST
jgi:hypothetical protein